MTLVEKITNNFNVTIVDEDKFGTFRIKGEDAELRKVKEFLDSEGLVCDNSTSFRGIKTQKLPETFGNILVAYGEGYFIAPPLSENENNLGFLVTDDSIEVLEAFMAEVA